MRERLFHAAAARFEAARRLENVPDGHRLRNIHGHSFLARVRAELPLGWGPYPGGEARALTDALTACVAGLDYGHLNERLPLPTDTNLARWVKSRLEAPGVEAVGIQSTSDRGVDLDHADRAHLWRRFRFEAAHRLPNVPDGHKCGRMHGHGFEIVLHADLAAAEQDYLDAAWAPLHRDLDHACLNDLPGLANPTSEMLCIWLWERLKPRLPTLSWISVHETATAGCHFDGQDHRIFKEQRFEGAVRLVRAPDNDSGRRLHGHSYRLRLHVTAPVDTVRGWVMDYGDIKERFRPVYERLDHQLLNELPRLEDVDPASLVLWLREAVVADIPCLDRIDLEETPGCGATLCWGAHGPALPA